MTPIDSNTLSLIIHLEWSKGVNDYKITDDGKSAKRVNPGGGCLYSAWRGYTCGHSIVFKVLETGEHKTTDGIAVCATAEKTESLSRANSLFVSSSGLLSFFCRFVLKMFLIL